MLVDSRRFRAGSELRKTQITLFVSGVFLAFVALVFSVVYLGYQGVWFHAERRRESINDPLQTFTTFVSVLDEETDARVLALPTVADKSKATNAALAAFVSSMGSGNGISTAALQVLFAQYRAVGVGTDKMGVLLILHISVVEEAAAQLLSLIYEDLTPNPKFAVNTLIADATVAAFNSVAARTQFLHGTRAHLTGEEKTLVTPKEATTLALRVAIAEGFKRLADQLDHGGFTNVHADLFEKLIGPAQDVVLKTFGFRQFSVRAAFVAMPNTMESIEGLSNFLFSRETVAEARLSEEVRGIALIAVGAGLTVPAIVIVGCLWWKYRCRVEPTRRLAAAFEDTEHQRQLRLQYLPLLQDLRAVSLPSPAEAAKATEVEHEYLIAARAVDALRVAVPQLLMSDAKFSLAAGAPAGLHSSTTNTHSTNNPPQSREGTALTLASKEEHLGVGGGANRLLHDPARLELGSVLCRCAVVAEFNVFPTRLGQQLPLQDLREDLDTLSRLYHVIVTEVNLSGGVVLGFCEGVNVMCAWNVGSTGSGAAKAAEVAKTGEAVAAAIRVSWIVRHRLQKEEGLLAEAGDAPPDGAQTRSIAHMCACIVSGPAVLSNDAVIGDRRDAFLQGSFLANLEKMRLVARTAGTSTLLDAGTQMRLLTTWQRHSCKPLVVLKSANAMGTFTVCSASEEDGCMSADQAVLYNAGFVLYQNNMFKEAVNEFKRYLGLYPDDRRALWLMNHVLLPKQCSLNAR